MRVRCRAVADPHSNALGRLELESTPAGLWLAYQGVRSYRDGYAPGPAAIATEHRVPWHAVRVTRIGAEQLRLEVQEPLSPFSRFQLRDFERAEAAAWIARARPWARLSSSPVVLTEFCHELSEHLGGPVASEMTVPAELGAPRALRRFPRTGAALSILLLSCTLAALMLGKARSFSAPAPEPSPERPRHEPLALAVPAQSARGPQPAHSAAPAEIAQPPAPAAPTLGLGCECVRQDSALWEPPPARLTVLVAEQRLEPHGSHQHLHLQLALVNNADRSLTNLNLKVRIRGPRLGPPGSDDAPVERIGYFPGPLEPGHQLRWNVSARGDRFELHAPELGRLDEDGIDAAPADAFLDLAAAPHGVVSLHAGLMLAFLGDARARETLLRLRSGRSQNELEVLDRGLESTALLRACQLVVSQSGPATRVQSCLYNAGDEPQADIEVKVRALGRSEAGQLGFAPAALLAEHVIAHTGSLAPRRGRRLELTLDLPQTDPAGARRFELVARSKEAR